MRLGIRVPLLIGAVVLITSASIGLIALEISSRTLERTILSAISDKNHSNAILLSTTLDGQLDLLGEIANCARMRTMDWEIIQSNLVLNITRVNAIDMALITPEGIYRYALDNVTINVNDREYFRRAMAGEQCIEVVYSRFNNGIVVVFAVPIFLDNEPGAPVIGVLIARKDGGETLSNKVGNLINTIPNAYNYLVDSEGTVIAHPDTELVTNRFNPVREAENDPSLRQVANVITTALSDRNGMCRYTYRGRDLLGVYTEVPGYPWILFNTVERKEVYGPLVQTRAIIFSLGFILIVAGLITAIVVGISIAKPVVHVAKSLKNISESDSSPTRIIVDSNDETGEIALYINRTLEKMTKEIREAKEHAELSSRAKSEFLSRMSHEMRTPMNAIMGMAKLIRMKGIPNEAKRYIDEIDNTSHHLLHLIDDVLDISGMEYGVIKLSSSVFDFRAMASDALQKADITASKKQQLLSSDINPAIPGLLEGDEKHLKKVIDALLANAVKFTPEHGKIRFNADVLPVEDDEKITLQIEIFDTGIGIPKDQQNKMFELFELGRV